MAENTTDRRVRKTRGQLRQGLVRLMREKSIQDITVKELCEECDINRGTFYLHYTDVYQLLHSIEDELLVEFERVLDGLTAQSVLAAATPSPAMCSMFELLADNADMCLVLLCHNGDMAFLEQVKDDYVYSFIVSGCIGMLQCWLEKEMPISPREMAAMVEGVLVKGVTALL